MKIGKSSFAITALALAAAFAAGPAAAQDYGYYVDHQADLATPLAAGGANVTNNEWLNLGATGASAGPGGSFVSGLAGTGSFPGTAAWSGKSSQVDSSIGSVGGSLGGATLSKVANGPGNQGGGYAAGSSIYFGGFSADPNNLDGTLRVADSTPLSGLQTVAFQIGIGEAFTYDFFNHVLPTLSYVTSAGTFSNLAATFSDVLEKFANGTVEMPTGPGGALEEVPIYINQYALQWDLSSVVDPITSFSIDFSGVQHAQVYGLTLTEGDQFSQVVGTVAAVPEPETYAMMLAGLMGIGFMARRRRDRSDHFSAAMA